MIFRRLSPADVTEYRRLRLYGLREASAAFGSSYEEESKRPLPYFAARLEAGGDNWTLGAFFGKRLVGVIRLVRDPSLKGRHKAAIYGMYVAPAFRKRGVGRGLLALAVDLAKCRQGVRQVLLSVVSSNRAALRLYETAGFVVYGQEPGALCVRGRYYDETLLCLRLTRRSSVRK